jgi:hypothetical protein
MIFLTFKMDVMTPLRPKVRNRSVFFQRLQTLNFFLVKRCAFVLFQSRVTPVSLDPNPIVVMSWPEMKATSKKHLH